MKKIVAERTDIAFYIKLFPLKFHPDAYWKSKAMVCARSLGLLEDNFEKRPVPRPECDTDSIDNTVKLAERLGITGTPTIVLPDGFVSVGAIRAEAISKLVSEHAQKAPRL